MNEFKKEKFMFKKTITFIIHNSSFLILLASCGTQKQIDSAAKTDVLETKALKAAHVGLSIYDPSTNKYLCNYQGDKYFVPASNTKIPTCYAAMKYLGDSLTSIKYILTAHTLQIIPNGDPTFLLDEFPYQPVFDLIKKSKREVIINLWNWVENGLGSGWSWNDYQEYYMAERSLMPVYGNMIRFSGTQSGLHVSPRILPDSLLYDSTDMNSYIKDVERSRTGNIFKLIAGGRSMRTIERTFDTKDGYILKKLLEDTLHLPVNVYKSETSIRFNTTHFPGVKSQPTDSLLKPMMHRSDNFFAEQSLLMVSNGVLGYMNDERIIDTLVKTDFKDLPQRPHWADGSGLSRYNLFTPQDFVAILNKMKNDFGMERIKTIFATGGEGTISSYYKADSGFIYGKTGTLSGVVAFSGFMYTKKGKLLIFSTLVNNHTGSATEVRRAIEKFLQRIRNSY